MVIKKKINFGLILLIFLLSVALVFASPPPLPDKFSGNVLINDENAPIGTEIDVYVNETLDSTYTLDEIGKYTLDVKSGFIDDIIIFKIEDVEAGKAVRGWGTTTDLDLNATIQEESTEEQPSISGDGSSGGGGGGGGGSSSKPPTVVQTPVKPKPLDLFNLDDLPEGEASEDILEISEGDTAELQEQGFFARTWNRVKNVFTTEETLTGGAVVVVSNEGKPLGKIILMFIVLIIVIGGYISLNKRKPHIINKIKGSPGRLFRKIKKF